VRLILLNARKDLIRIRRDPVSVAVWLGIPVFIAVMMLTLFGRGGEARPQGLLLLADQDDTFLSGALGNAYTRGELGEMITVEQVPLDVGRERISRGDGSALLIVPEGFTEAFLGNETAELELITNPSQSILPGMIEEVTAILLDAAYYLHKLFGEEVDRFIDVEGAPPDEMVAETSVRVNRIFTNLAKYLDPMVIELSSEVVDTSGPSLNMADIFLPSMVFMAVLFLSFGFGADIWKEKDKGTLRRVVTTPGSVGGFLAGKLLAVGVLFVLVAGVAIAAAVVLLGFSASNPLLAVAWVTACGVAGFLLVLLLSTHASNQRSGSLITNLTMMILMMVGGSFFPFELMPDFLRRIGEMTPNGWALIQLRAILAGDLGPASAGIRFLWVGLFSAAAFLLTQRRLKGGFLN
jgi:ABC-type multidrug transport system permease subunit